MHRFFILMLAAWLTFGTAAGAEWELTYQDQFDRPALGTNWLILRGDWHINEAGWLQIQRQWPSHSFIMCTLPLRGRNVRAEFDLLIPSDQKGSFGAFLQAGPLGWGGGGIDDRVGLELRGCTEEELRKIDDPRRRALSILVDEVHHVAIQLRDGRYSISVNGNQVRTGKVRQGRSLYNSGLQFTACPGGRVDNVRIFTASMAEPLPVLNVNTPEQNRQATVFAREFYDPKKPDCGFQAAIDSLPPGGGVVVLPKGEFLLRRFLEIRSHTTLAGQGPETVLQVMDTTAARVKDVSSKDGVYTLRLEPGHDFQPGDAFSYDNRWGHPINARAPGVQGPDHLLGPRGPSQNRLLVLDVDGDTVRVNAPPPKGRAKRIVHFFPAVCSYQSEYVDVRDLQIRGPGKNPAGVGGGFMTNPITFGVTSYPRITRLYIRNWPADGISLQGCNDGRISECTIEGVHLGMHPGTTTTRMIVARNYSVENNSGLYFCWYNSHGIYYRNVLKNITGYADAGDVFNTIVENHLSEGMGITVGYNGCLVGNVIPGLTIFGPKNAKTPHGPDVLGPGGRTYGLPPRYFVIALNTVEKIALYQYAHGNVIAYNRRGNGAVPEFVFRATPQQLAEGEPKDNIIVWGKTSGDLSMAKVPRPPKRAARPPGPPRLPTPVLDGRDFYDPAAPDCGFQAAIDKLAGTGGTLRLPGGRYPIRRTLQVPGNVNLAGYGSGTILLMAGDVPVVRMTGRGSGGVRDLAIEGDWSQAPQQPAAIQVQPAGQDIELSGLDVRGVPADGIACEDLGGRIVDCRVTRCGGIGYRLRGGRPVISTSSAVACRVGYDISDAELVQVTGCISALNHGPGFAARTSSLLLKGNNAHNNLEDGILLSNCRDATVLGNTCAANNQAGQAFAGIRVPGPMRHAGISHNNCGDAQLFATQLVGIEIGPKCRGAVLVGNVTATLCRRRGHEGAPSLICLGPGALVRDNWTSTILPANDSLEVLDWRKEQGKR